MFLFFDMGNVLLRFDHRRAAQQMAEVAGTDPERVWQVVFESDLEFRFERGEISREEFYDVFCRETDTRPAFDALEHAGSAIFTPNYSIFGLIASLNAAGYHLGILSNTCESHWRYCLETYEVIRTMTDVYVLSYEAQAMKPDAKIYQAAADAAGVPPEEIFFTDDTTGHVEGARSFGFDAEIYTSTAQLVSDLIKRGIRSNY
jgi:putative hydrolase of the HAD superfamily